MKQGSLIFEEDEGNRPIKPVRPKYLTVSEFTAVLRNMFETEFSSVLIAGEISSTRAMPSGHVYFTLKDNDAQLSCVVYKSSMRFLRFKPKDGVAVIARGRVDVWKSGLQLVVESLEPQGAGALQVAFEQLKKKLDAEGLFDPERKRPLPRLPQRIGIVTSPSGAVLQDILQILERRFPGLHVRVFPVLVQGEGSVEQVCRGLRYFSESNWAQVVILARGGGSLEDLWTFNEEAVARAIDASAVPVISAIGHETDFTIADFVADLRAPTPSAAAEVVIVPRGQILDQFASLAARLSQSMRYRISQLARRLHQLGIDRPATILRRRLGRSQQRLDEAGYRLRQLSQATIQTRRRRLLLLTARIQQRDVRLQFGELHKRMERLDARLKQAIERKLNRSRARIEPAVAHLTQLSPLKILDRGYAIVLNEGGAVIKSPADAPGGSQITVRLAEGKLAAVVLEPERDTMKEHLETSQSRLI